MAALQAGRPPVSALPRATVTIDREAQRLVIELPATDLPASSPGQMAMVNPPICQAVIPMDVSLFSVRAEVVDSQGLPLPKAFLHHFNLTDPARRDLFLPTALHLMAASKETPAVGLPQLIVGLPVVHEQPLIVTAMLSNPTSTSYHGVRVRWVFGFRPLGVIFPIFRAYPWVMDAQFPTGERVFGRPAFDLPPGRSVFSWDSRPAIPGYVVGIGGHVHDYAVGLELSDVTTGTILWRAVPVRDSHGHVLSMPVQRFYNWHRIGIHVDPSHMYRVAVTYENPTPQTIPEAAMGSVAGLFVPEFGSRWPGVDTTNAVYQRDLSDALTVDDMSHMRMDAGSR
jgi:hypothetical protein